MGTPLDSKNTGLKKNIAIPLFSNSTFEPILSKVLTQIFKRTFYTNGWEVENQRKIEGLNLQGKITSFSQTPTSLTPAGGVREYKINLGIKVILFRDNMQEPVFTKEIMGISDYVARSDPAENRSAKDRAIREAGREIAEQTAALLSLVRHKKAEPVEK